MMGAIIVSYFIMLFMYRKKFSESFTFTVYVKRTWFLMLFNILDLSTVYLSVSICRILWDTYWGLIPLGVFIVIYVLVCRRYFGIINSQQQAYLTHRLQHSWAYYYDEKYHLYYIDFLYDEGSQKVQSEEEYDLGVLSDDGVVNGNPNSGRAKPTIRAFFPRSNLVIMEIIWKAAMGAAVVLLFDFKPSLLAYPIILLNLILVCWMGVFYSYEKVQFWCYMGSGLMALLCYALYWYSYFWAFSVVLGLAYSVVFLSAIIFGLLTFTRMN